MTSGTVHLRTLGLPDIPRAVEMSSEPGWNQVDSDWRLMIGHGDSFGLVAEQDRLVATGLTVEFGGPFGWISMILVTAAYRRRGFATRLMQVCMDALRRRGLTPALDASPEGRRIYLPLGFKDIYRTTRMAAASGVRAMTVRPASIDDVRAMRPEDLRSVAAYDVEPFGADRGYLLDHLYRRMRKSAFLREQGGRIKGFVLARDGRLGAQIGPLVADDPITALALLKRAVRSVPGAVCLDVGDHHTAMRTWLDEQGFAPVVPFTRMVLDRSEPFDDPARIFAIAGPELG